jgi:hypothetical protein
MVSPADPPYKEHPAEVVDDRTGVRAGGPGVGIEAEAARRIMVVTTAGGVRVGRRGHD